jgi:hypothetical protein
MTQDEIIEMARRAGVSDDGYRFEFNQYKYLEFFAHLVAQHVRKTMNDEAKAHLEELRKNFNAESAELRLHMWSKEKHDST